MIELANFEHKSCINYEFDLNRICIIKQKPCKKAPRLNYCHKKHATSMRPFGTGGARTNLAQVHLTPGYEGASNSSADDGHDDVKLTNLANAALLVQGQEYHDADVVFQDDSESLIEVVVVLSHRHLSPLSLARRTKDQDTTSVETL